MQKNKELEAKAFWERMGVLIGSERPYAWVDKVGINKGAFQSAYERRSRPLNKTLDKWAKKIGCNPDWLKTGKGEPWVKLDPDAVVTEFLAGAPTPFLATDESNAERIMIDVMDVKVCCGEGSDGFEFEPLKKRVGFDASFFEKRGRKPENCVLLFATNDSMEDYICDGDAFMIDTSVIEPKDGKIYAIWFEGERMLKRVFKEEGGALRLTSNNKKYPDKIVTEKNGGDFRIIGEQFYRSG